jgi:hypothetical protein
VRSAIKIAHGGPPAALMKAIEATRGTRAKSLSKVEVEAVLALYKDALVETKRLEQRRAVSRYAVSQAVKAGLLVRPEVCSECKTAPLTWRGNPSRIEFHHAFGYEEGSELRGTWLCQKCHAHQPSVDGFQRENRYMDILRDHYDLERRWIADRSGLIAFEWGAVDGFGDFYVVSTLGQLIPWNAHMNEADVLKEAIVSAENAVARAKADVTQAEAVLAELSQRIKVLDGEDE